MFVVECELLTSAVHSYGHCALLELNHRQKKSLYFACSLGACGCCVTEKCTTRNTSQRGRTKLMSNHHAPPEDRDWHEPRPLNSDMESAWKHSESRELMESF